MLSIIQIVLVLIGAVELMKSFNVKGLMAGLLVYETPASLSCDMILECKFWLNDSNHICGKKISY